MAAVFNIYTKNNCNNCNKIKLSLETILSQGKLNFIVKTFNIDTTPDLLAEVFEKIDNASLPRPRSAPIVFMKNDNKEYFVNIIDFDNLNSSSIENLINCIEDRAFVIKQI